MPSAADVDAPDRAQRLGRYLLASLEHLTSRRPWCIVVAVWSVLLLAPGGFAAGWVAGIIPVELNLLGTDFRLDVRHRRSICSTIV